MANRKQVGFAIGVALAAFITGFLVCLLGSKQWGWASDDKTTPIHPGWQLIRSESYTNGNLKLQEWEDSMGRHITFGLAENGAFKAINVSQKKAMNGSRKNKIVEVAFYPDGWLRHIYQWVNHVVAYGIQLEWDETGDMRRAEWACGLKKSSREEFLQGKCTVKQGIDNSTGPLDK
ncbi:MAG: hypothetical protein ACLFWL_17950 [Candidatus Brocadiia bacterium]